MRQVAFLHIEAGDDLIVSFAIEGDGPDQVKSLTLLRTPKYDFMRPDDERGVGVSYDDYPDDQPDLLRALEFRKDSATIVTQQREYSIDLSRIDPTELEQAIKVLKMMNFDKRFELRI